jgi:E3 ubiquitin-protein ligase synoviolin
VTTELQKISFDMVLTFVFIRTGHEANIFLAAFPLLLHYVVRCLRQRVVGFPLSPERPPAKRHTRLLFGQLIAVLVAFYGGLQLFKIHRGYTELLLLFVAHAGISEILDIVRHLSFISDRNNMGNSTQSYRINVVAEFFCAAADLVVDVGFMWKIMIKEKAPISMLRPIYENSMELYRRVIAFQTWRRMQSFIKDCLPDATMEDLGRDDTCIVCRLVMRNGQAKKLPCGHCLHCDCLERWIGQQSKCPICQADLKSYLEEAEKRGKEIQSQNENQNVPEEGNLGAEEGEVFDFATLDAGE